MSRAQAANYLGMTLGDFSKALEGRFLGVFTRATKPAVLEAVLGRDHGVCFSCGCDMSTFAEDFQRAYAKHKKKKSATLINPHTKELQEYTALCEQYGISGRNKTFWFAAKAPGYHRKKTDTLDAGHQTTCFACFKKFSTVTPLRDRWVPKPIEGSITSKAAKFSRASIELFQQVREVEDTKIGLPRQVYKLRSFFKLYLTRTVCNHYKNYCRSIARKAKEFFPGDDAEGNTWESTLIDTDDARPDDILALMDALRYMASGKRKQKVPVNDDLINEIIYLAAEGMTPSEIVLKLELPKKVLKYFPDFGPKRVKPKSGVVRPIKSKVA